MSINPESNQAPTKNNTGTRRADNGVRFAEITRIKFVRVATEKQ